MEKENPNFQIQNVDLRSEEVQEILRKIPHWMIRWGSVLFLILILMLFLISWFVRYPDVLKAEGYVTTEIPPQKIKATVFGTMDTILVQENQIVKQGQNLGVLETTANFRHVELLKAILDTTGLINGQFYFPVDELPFLFLGEIGKSYFDFETKYMNYRLEKELNPFESQLLANKISHNKSQERLDVLFAQQHLAEKKLVFQRKNLERISVLFEKGVVSAQELEEQEQEFLSVNQTFKNLSMEISQTKEAIAMAENGSTRINIEKVQEQKQLLKAVLQSFNHLKIALKDWEEKYVFSTDIEGKVAFTNYLSKNQNVDQGDVLFTIIPNKSSYYTAKVLISPQNSGKIKVGQRVDLSLSNFLESEYGLVRGQVKNISLVPDGQGFYLIDVSLPAELRTNYGKEIPFKPEMRGTASIITEDLRFIERIFYRLRDIFRK